MPKGNVTMEDIIGIDMVVIGYMLDLLVGVEVSYRRKDGMLYYTFQDPRGTYNSDDYKLDDVETMRGDARKDVKNLYDVEHTLVDIIRPINLINTVEIKLKVSGQGEI